MNRLSSPLVRLPVTAALATAALMGACSKPADTPPPSRNRVAIEQNPQRPPHQTTEIPDLAETIPQSVLLRDVINPLRLAFEQGYISVKSNQREFIPLSGPKNVYRLLYKNWDGTHTFIQVTARGDRYIYDPDTISEIVAGHYRLPPKTKHNPDPKPVVLNSVHVFSTRVGEEYRVDASGILNGKPYDTRVDLYPNKNTFPELSTTSAIYAGFAVRAIKGTLHELEA